MAGGIDRLDPVRRLTAVAVVVVVVGACASVAVGARLVATLTFDAAGVHEPRSDLVVPDVLKPAAAVSFVQRGVRYRARLLLVERTPIAPGPFSAARPHRTNIVTRLELRAPGAHGSVALPDATAQVWVRGDPFCAPSRTFCPAGSTAFGVEHDGSLSYRVRSDGQARAVTRAIPVGSGVVQDASADVPAQATPADVEIYLEADGPGSRVRDARFRLTLPGM